MPLLSLERLAEYPTYEVVEVIRWINLMDARMTGYCTGSYL